MSKKELTRAQAFQKALQKWSDIIEGKPGVDPWSSCALCTLTGNGSECSYCPLVQYGGNEFGCDHEESPWRRVTTKWGLLHNNIVSRLAFPRDVSAISAAMAMYLAILMARDSKKG